MITCNAKGSAEFREREVGGAWITRKIEPGAMFVTHSKTPYEVRWTSPAGQEVEVIQIHLAVDVFRAALEESYPGKAHTVEVIDFFGRDEAFAHLCQACADMLTARTRGNTRRVADLTRLFASYLVEQYTDAARERAEPPHDRASRVKSLRSTRLMQLFEPRSVEVSEENGGRSLCACRPKSRAIGLDAGERPREHLS